MNSLVHRAVQRHTAEQAQAVWPSPRPTCKFPDCREVATHVVWFDANRKERVTLVCDLHMGYAHNLAQVVKVERISR